MKDAEVDIVAAELAKIGGTSWYPGREKGSILRVVSERYRDRARAAIAALDRYRASQANAVEPPGVSQDDDMTTSTPLLTPADVRIGATIVYRPPGDRRAYVCRIEKIAEDFVYLVPQAERKAGWVPAAEIWTSPNFMKDLQSEQERLEKNAPLR